MRAKHAVPKTLLPLLGISATAAFAYGSLVERNNYQLRQLTLPVLAPSSDPIRILHLSDLHMASWQHEKQNWVASLIDYDPHLIINTGDNLGHANGLEGLRRAFDVFASVPGVFVFGSNDYFEARFKNPFGYFAAPSRDKHLNSSRVDTAGLAEYLCSLGWHNLNNDATILQLSQTTFELFGVNDPHIKFDRMDLLPASLEKVRESSTYTQSDIPVLSLGVVHAPYRHILNTFVTYGANIIFAGHTHGGQVCLPQFGALVTNCDIPRKYARGLHTWSRSTESSYLNVSAGLGTSIYAPVRFFCPPEASLITLTAAGS